jgi:hypothetical protein
MSFLSFLLLASFSFISQSSASREPAPYIRPEAPLVDNSYIVALYPNHTLEAHFDFIHLNLSQTASSFIPLPITNSYIAVLDNHTVHDLVRHDPGVRYIEHDCWLEITAPEEHGPSYNYTAPQVGLSRRWSETRVSAAPWYVSMLTVAKKLPSPWTYFSHTVTQSFLLQKIITCSTFTNNIFRIG